MAIAALNDWLNSPTNYQAGIELYRQFCDGSKLALLQSGNSSFTRDMLRAELEAINDAATVELPTHKVKKEPHQTPELDSFRAHSAHRQNTIDYGKLTPELKALANDKGALYNMVRHMHSQLPHLATDEERLAFLFKMEENRLKIEAIWAKLDEFHANGYQALPSKLDKLSPMELLKLRNNNRSYISKYQGDKTKAKQVASRAEENADIERRLGDG